MSKRNKAGKVLKEPRTPSTNSLTLFTTKAYAKYVERKHGNFRRPSAAKGDVIMKDFRGYPLFIDEFTTPEDIPRNARIDDYTLAKLIDAKKTAKWYNDRWPVEFVHRDGLQEKSSRCR